MNDGHNYYPTHRWVLFGHHFAAITGAGPLIGPVLAAQFGFAPGLLWLVAGVCLGGRRARLHHPVGLDPPRRQVARPDRAAWRSDRVAGITAGIAILFIVVIALAGLGLAVVNALQESAVGHVHDRHDDPARAVHGPVHVPASARADRRSDDHRRDRAAPGGHRLGKPDCRRRPSGRGSRSRASSSSSRWRSTASSRPCCRSGCSSAPRDYLSSFMKIGTIAFLVVGGHHRQSRAADAGVQRSSPAAAARSFPGRCSRSRSSPSPAARSRGSTR